MNRLLLVSLFALPVFACGATHAEAVPPRVEVTPPTTPSPTPEPTSLAAPSPATAPYDDLVSRGLKRAEARPRIAPPDWSDTLGSLYVLALTRDGQTAIVGDGARLHSGEQFELHVSVGRPAYVHLVQISGTDQATILYPVEGEPERLMPGVDQRIPTSPDVRFELDDVTGTERLAFIVSEQPLASGDPELRAFVDRMRATGRWPAPTASPSPAKARAMQGPSAGAAAPAPSAKSAAKFDSPREPLHGTSDVRGIVRRPVQTGRLLDVQPDEKGVAVAFFAFEHVQ